MTSVHNRRPAQYRARATEAREKAAAATNEETRQLLLHDAELWEKMAEYEEKGTLASDIDLAEQRATR
jgi:hypothetical protein